MATGLGMRVGGNRREAQKVLRSCGVGALLSFSALPPGPLRRKSSAQPLRTSKALCLGVAAFHVLYLYGVQVPGPRRVYEGTKAIKGGFAKTEAHLTI
jgi:hypothetical protein